MTGASTSTSPPPPLIHQREPQPKPNILPLLILQQRSLFKTLSNGFEKLQELVDDNDCPAKQGFEKVSLALGELSDSVRTIRCRMDAFIGMASEAGCIDLVGAKKPEEGAVSPLTPPAERTGETEMDVLRNFSRPFPRSGGTSGQRQGCDYETACKSITMSFPGDTSPGTRCRDLEHNQAPTIPTLQAPSTTPSAQDDGRALSTQPKVSVLINSPLDGSNIRKQVKRASRVRDPYFNEVRRISVLKAGVIRTTYYQTEPVDTETLAAGEDGNSLSSYNSDNRSVESMGRIRRIGVMVRHGRRFLGWESCRRRRRQYGK